MVLRKMYPQFWMKLPDREFLSNRRAAAKEVIFRLCRPLAFQSSAAPYRSGAPVPAISKRLPPYQQVPEQELDRQAALVLPVSDHQDFDQEPLLAVPEVDCKSRCNR